MIKLLDVFAPTNLPIWPICELASKSANLRLASRFANGTDCFHHIIIFVMICNEIGWHDLQLDRFLENLQIVQCNLQIGQPIGKWDDQSENHF